MSLYDNHGSFFFLSLLLTTSARHFINLKLYMTNRNVKVQIIFIWI
jgi:hypothetical protein